LSKPSAIYHLNQSLSIRKKIQDFEGMYASYKSFAEYYQTRNEPSIAQKYADSALQVANQHNSPMYRKDAYALLIDLGKTEYVLPFKNLTDSLVREQQMADTQFASLRYNVDQERRKSEALQLEKEKEKQLRWIIIGLFLIVVLGLMVYLWIHRLKAKQREQEQVVITENRISKKVHDEVANEIYGLMTRVQGEKSKPEELIDQLEHVYQKTRNISREYNPIDQEEDFSIILADLISTYKSETVNVLTRDLSKIAWQKVKRIKRNVLYRVLQELLTNMKKHSEASVVVISFKAEGKKIYLEYADNGKGTELRKTGGLHITETRIQSIGGSIIFETEPGKGFKAKITI